VTHTKQQKNNVITPWTYAVLIISSALDAIKYFFAVLYVSLNDGPYTLL